MKIKTTLFLLTLTIASTLILSTAFAEYEPHTQVGLPEGAKARFGTGPLLWFGYGIAYSPNTTNPRLAVSGEIGIWIYDAETLQVLDLLPGPMPIVRSLSFSPDADTLAAGLFDGTVDLWDVTTSTLRKTLTPRPDVAYSDESGYWYHTRTRHERSVISVSFNSDGTILAAGINNGTIEFWNAATGELQKILEGHDETVDSNVSMRVRFSADGGTLASASKYSEVHLWDVATGKLRKTLGQQSRYTNDVSFSPDGSTLATYNHFGTLLWDVATGELLKIFEKPPEARNHINSGPNISFSPDGSTLAAYGYYTVYLWDVATGTVQNTIKMPYSSVKSLNFSPDGGTLAVTEYNEVFLLDIATGEPREPLKGSSLNPFSVVISPDGHTLAIGNLLWDISTGTLRNTLKGHAGYLSSISFSPDGSTLATGDWDGTVRLWDVATGTLRYMLKGHTDPVMSVSFSPDGSTLASGSVYYPPINYTTEPAVSIPDPNLQQQGGGELLLWDVATGQQKNNLTGHTGNVYSVSFSPDGKNLTAGIYDTVHLWDIATGQLSNTFTEHGGIVYSVRFSPDGSTIATGSGISPEDLYLVDIDIDTWAQDENGAIRLWDASTGQLKTTLKEHTTNVYRVNFSPDGQILASGGQGGWVHLWEVATSTPNSILKGHVGDVYSISFSLDGSTLATGSYDGTVLLWEVGTAEALPQLAEDINGDGVVNIQDLVIVASRFGQTGENNADVNGDGVVNIADLVLVAAALGEAPAAPTVRHHANEHLTPEVVQQWLAAAKQLARTDATAHRGIAVLEALLAALTPEDTALLPNYPNPFNPETWIPYQLAKSIDVNVLIYSADGKLVRTLKLGQQAAGIYESRSRAAYWDGKNEVGESVASGVYFYTLKAGGFTATQKMLIRK